MEQVNTNPMIWALFVNAFMKAAVQLGKDCEENLRVTKNTEFSEIRLSFSLTRKLIFDQELEIFGTSKIDGDTIS